MSEGRAQADRRDDDDDEELDVADLTTEEVEDIVQEHEVLRRRDLLRLVSLLQSALGYLKYVDAISTVQEGSTVEQSFDGEQVYVVHSQPQARVCEPAHLVLVDDRAHRIVVAFRGSQQREDWLTNIRCGSQPFPVPRPRTAEPIELPEVERGSDGRQAHSGMLQASVKLVGQLMSYLQTLVKQHPTYRIRVVGHSLGAGVASLFTLLIRQSFPTARAVVFAPPACVSESMVPETLECITSFVNANDCVPSASAANMALPFGLLGGGQRLVPPGKLLHLTGAQLSEDGDAAAASSRDSRLAFKQAWMRDHKELGKYCCTDIAHVSYLRFCQFGLASLIHALEHSRSSYKVSLVSLRDFLIAQLQSLEVVPPAAITALVEASAGATENVFQPFRPSALVMCLEGVLLDCAESVAQSTRAALVDAGERYLSPVLPVDHLAASFVATSFDTEEERKLSRG